MRFGETPIAQAEGAILAHGLVTTGLAFKKGRVLSAEDVAALTAAGYGSVVAARLEDGDVGEDEAAHVVARAAVGDHVSLTPPTTGRCNVVAGARGLMLVDVPRLNRLNLVDEAVTIATLPPYHLAEPGQMVATVKIIPFAVPSATLAACSAIAGEGGGGLIGLAPLRMHRAGLVQTRTPGTKESVLDKTVATTRARLATLGSDLAGTAIVAHHERAVGEAIARMQNDALDPILVLGGSAIVDRRDVIPAALTAVGGEVIHFGMPVDPGNLLMLGRLGRAWVLGLPGCARSPALNGFDWVLQRLLADRSVTRADIMAMGAGGLLTEIASRPPPRGRSGAKPGDMESNRENDRESNRENDRKIDRESQVGDRRAGNGGGKMEPDIAAVVLAAGRSSRSGGINKLLAEIDGVPMVARVVDAALGSRARSVIVVVGHQADAVEAALAGRPVHVVRNPAYGDGLSASIRAGIDALPHTVDGALFMLADMPKVATRHVDRLIAAFDPPSGRAVCVPTWREKRGNPVLWSARFFADLRALEGDVGARGLLGVHGDAVHEVAMADDAVLVDCDTTDALAAIAGP